MIVLLIVRLAAVNYLKSYRVIHAGCSGIAGIYFVAFCYACGNALEGLSAVPKASSPLRLQRELMESAARIGARHHRSAAQQIEYWAALGRQVASLLDPDSVLDVASGITRLTLQPVAVPSVNAEDVFAAVDADRASGALAEAVTTSACRYQACRKHPGYLEQLLPDGSSCVGLFRDGIFYPVPKP